jgi:hypothetical protein
MGRPALVSTLDTIAEATMGPPPRADLDAIEVSQAIQDLSQSVPLIAAKRTYVRAYLGVPAGALTVRGELRVARQAHGPWESIPSAGDAALDASRAGSTLADLQSRRDNLGNSLNFRLPARFTGAGTLWLRLGHVREAGSGQRVHVTDPVGTRTVTFTQGEPLRLRVINLRYTTGNPPVTYEASANDLAHLRSWLRRAYPVPDVVFSAVTTNATAAWPFDSGQANAQVAAIRALDMAAGGDQRTHYYGIVSDGGGFMRGSAAGIPATPDPSVVASGPTGAATWGWDSDGSYGDWYGGHELGHTFGRFHPGFCGESHDDPNYPFTAGQLANADDAFVGLDRGDAALGLAPVALPGTQWHDVMTYCPTQWLSAYTSEGIRARIADEAALFPGAVAPAPAAAATVMGGAVDRALVHLAAVVNLTRRSGSIQHVTPLPGPVPLSPAPEAGASRLSVRTVGASPEEIPVAFKPDSDPASDDQTGLVDAVLAVDPGSRAIELLLDGEPIARFETGAEPAPVRNLQVQPPDAAPMDGAGGAGESVTVAGSRLSWDDAGAAGAGPAEAGHRSYVVQASTDHGRTWTTLAVGATGTSLPLNPADFADAEQVRFRVLTSNGLAYSEATTEDLPVSAL